MRLSLGSHPRKRDRAQAVEVVGWSGEGDSRALSESEAGLAFPSGISGRWQGGAKGVGKRGLGGIGGNLRATRGGILGGLLGEGGRGGGGNGGGLLNRNDSLVDEVSLEKKEDEGVDSGTRAFSNILNTELLFEPKLDAACS